MSQNWRRKTYYRPRVLVDTERVLNPEFCDVWLCLTGSQLEMLRNLTQYLRRRSTYASEYAANTYLAPTEAEWDDILAIVADLEEKLMGCDDLTTAIEQIAAQLNCICTALNNSMVLAQPQDEGYDGQEYYDDYISSVEADEGTPPGGLVSWDAWHSAVCIGSQKLVDDISSAITTIGESLAGGILVTFSVVNGWLLMTVIALPVALVIQVVTMLIALGVNFVYQDVVAWLSEHKSELVCAIYNATTASNAYSAVRAYIDAEWDAGSGKELVKTMLSYQAISDIFDYTQREFADWQGSYDPLYCSDCEDLPEGVEFVWTWPPCPAAHHQDGGVCSGGRLSFNGDTDYAHQQHLVSLGTYNQVTIEIRYRSKFGSGWTVGGAGVEWFDVGLDDWVIVKHCSADNTEDAGELNTVIDVFPVSPPQAGGLTRTYLHGATGQHDENPYPIQFEYVRILYESV